MRLRHAPTPHYNQRRVWKGDWMAKKKLPPMQKRTPDMPPPRGWKKQTLRMKDNHTWKAPDGYNILVVDRGALRFNVPKAWHVETGEQSASRLRRQAA